MEKPWYKSKTLWFNIVGGAVLLLNYLHTINIDWAWIGDALAVGNFILRFKTDSSVRL